MKRSFIFLLMLCSMHLFSQWTDDTNQNTLVSNSETSDVQSIGTSDGKTYVVYFANVSAPDYYELRVQLLDSEGFPLFGEEGILVNDTAAMSSSTVTRDIALDDNDNLYVAFTATGNGQGYVNKISPEGENLWGSAGITIGDGYDMKVLPQSNGAVVGWYNSGRGNIMKYDTDGNTVWEEAVTVQSPNSNPFTSIGEWLNYPDGGFLLLFHVRPISWSIDSNFFAQRYSADGEQVWDAPIQISDYTTMFNTRYKVIEDSDNNAYLGYYGSNGSRFDSFLQKIEPNGTLPWGINGTDFSIDDSLYEMKISIALAENSSYIWSVAQITTTNQGDYGTYIQKFNKDSGERLLSDTAKEVFPVSNQHFGLYGDLQIVEELPLFLFSIGFNNGATPIHLAATYLNDEGNFEWQEEYRLLATTDTSKSRIDFTQSFNNQSVAVWTEERDAVSRAYAQNIFVEVETASTEETDLKSLKYYPNPVNETLHISHSKNISKVELYDLTGKMVLSRLINGHSAELDVRELIPEVYVLKADIQGKVETYKIIVNK